MSKTKKPQITVEHSGPSIFEVARYVHEETVRHCDYCGRPMSRSDAKRLWQPM